MSGLLIISRSPDAEAAARGLEDDLARLAAEAGARVLIVPDIYHTAHDDPLRAQIADLTGRAALASWHHPRAAQWTLRALAPDLAELLAVDLRECAAAPECWPDLAAWLAPVGEGSVREIEGMTRERWYPVADHSRCTGCGHCVQFCIFGVWELRDGRAVAVAPDNCKPGCPACARICPHGAIIFPLCDEPDIAGAPGTLMAPDAEARRMYYLRTETPCPVCGKVAHPDDPHAPEGAPTCRECGRALQTVATADVREEIDALMAELDALAGEGRS